MTFGQAFENCKLGKRMKLTSWPEYKFIIMDEDKKMLMYNDGRTTNEAWLPGERELYTNEWELIY
jgi:hypothetical protein